MLRYLFGRRGTLFGSEHSGTLSLFRFLYCFAVGYEIATSARFADEDFLSGRTYHAVPLLAHFSVEALPLHWFQLLRWVLVGALFAASLGVLTRPALWVSFLGFVLYEGTALGFTKTRESDYVYHMSNLTVFALAILAIAPGVGRHGIIGMLRRRAPTQLPEWPRKTILGLLSIAYFGAFYCRMAGSPLWVDGYTIQGYLFERALKYDVPLAFEIAQNYPLCFAFGLGTVLFEATFFLVLVYPRLAWIYVPSGLMLHASIQHLMAIDFFEFFILNYLALIEWEPLRRMLARVPFLSRWPAPREAPVAAVPAAVAVPLAQRAVCIGLLAMQLGCVVMRVEHWPFSDYRVYSKRRSPDEVMVFTLGRRETEGRFEILPERTQRLFRRATSRLGLGPLTALALELPHGERDPAVNEIRQKCTGAIAEFRPRLLRQPEGIALLVEHVRRNPETKRYVRATDFVCDVVEPDPTLPGDPPGAESQDDG